MDEVLEEKNIDSKFLSIVIMLASACWQQLGKVPNPVTGKVERDVDSARITLDLLIMLRDKTKGNLSDEEERVLANTISDLQLNYADEVEKEHKKAELS